MLRRVRVVICVTTVTLASVLAFGVGARKTVALTVNGETTTVTTYAMSVDRLLQEQQVKVKTHDLVESTSSGTLQNHSVVTVRSAYQTTVTIDGQEVPFWTVATSADQLLGFFEANEAEASKITVNIDNVYNKLTGGLVINQNGPVTVIADGKSSVSPNGKLPAASILDSKGIILNKEDRVSVEKDNGETILRVQRVTHDEQTRTKTVPHGTQTIIDASLQPGEAVVRQEGEDGEIQQTYDVTYVDGVEESEKLINEVTTKIAIDQIIAVGPEKTESSDADNGQADPEATTVIRASPTRKTSRTRKIRIRPTRRTIPPRRTIRRPLRPLSQRKHRPQRRRRHSNNNSNSNRHRRQRTLRTAVDSTIHRLPRHRHMRPARQPSMAGPDSIGPIWSNYGIVNPAGCGIRRTRHPERTAFRNPCQAARWPLSARTGVMTQPCRSIGA